MLQPSSEDPNSNGMPKGPTQMYLLVVLLLIGISQRKSSMKEGMIPINLKSSVKF